ncbi:family 20 glycosylhydrolase [Actinomyces ruminis]|uniref:family 20 glycosylhydrolase n=1 Tax=Actinomyces ruminis TaxID=1937003 RepID=UPI00211E8C48|nr:family 20 glycosylhydrolase [Actinomyces ruminis]
MPIEDAADTDGARAEADGGPRDNAAPGNEPRQDAPEGDRDASAPTPSSQLESSDALSQEAQEFLAVNFLKSRTDVQRAARQGVRVILSPTSHCYLDQPHGDASLNAAQEERRSTLGLPHYRPVTLEAFADWDPAQMTTPAQSQIAGVEAALWCETAVTAEDRMLLLLPRLGVIANAAWRAENDTWADLAERVGAQAPLWSRLGLTWYRADTVRWADAV